MTDLNMEDIVLDGVGKSFGDHRVLEHISLTISGCRVTALMAPSGRGKTTLLRILMGLETPDCGTIRGLDGRKQSAVFQEDRLCENLSPIANIRLVAPEKKPSEILEAMESVGLVNCRRQPARELSGGMRRRVAILRALMADYDILFLDEPFKGLDFDTKELVLRYLRSRSAGKTVLLVTHDEREAEALKAYRMIRL